jgi:epoxyqueuosine reductase
MIQYMFFMNLTSQIKQKARELGIHKIGIASAEYYLLKELISTNGWHRGLHASMRWMEKNVEKRTDPRLSCPGAFRHQSCSQLLHSHAARSDPEKGKISRYAWGDDYHIHVTKRIQSLFECIKQLAPESDGRYYVDTGPVMEKVWAQRAGLGWQGKHTNLITKEYGSWVFLGEIITTLELKYDQPMEDFCGTCTACIDACPTDAIHQPYVVDSNRCISYLTIEHRGEIAESLGKKFDHWIYGCDICQDVCPWNRFQQETEQTEFTARKEYRSFSQ